MLDPVKDTLFALRLFGRNPGFAAVVIVTLGLGIGANTAIFSLVDGVLLKPLAFHDPDRLVMVWQKAAAVPQLGISELDLDDYRARTHVFASLGGFTPVGSKAAILTGAGDPIEIFPSYVTGNYFSMLGLKPVIGRDFLPEEDRRGHNNVAILSYSLWKSRFGASRQIVGRSIALNQQELHVIGVMGADAYPSEADVFVPFSLNSPEQPNPRNYHDLHVIGRLRSGQAPGAAEKEIDAVSRDLARSYAATNAGIGGYSVPLYEEITGKVRELLVLLLAAVGLILLIACGNVANLLLVRAATRQKEIAIRAALGADREHLIAQFGIECLMLSGAGALLGLLLAAASMPLLRIIGNDRIPRVQEVALDSRVLLFTAALTIASALLCGFLPAIRYSSGNLSRTLRTGGRTSSSDSSRVRSFLVAVQVAMALVVVVGASLLARSLARVIDVYPGFRADHLLTAQIVLPANQYKRLDIQKFYRRLLPEVASIPGVTAVATTTLLPLAANIPQTRFQVQGTPLPEPGRYPVAAIAAVDPDFFRTMGIPLLRGRTFLREEVGNLDNESCIVNLTLVRTFFAEQDPIGRTILTNVAAPQPEPCHVVGVVGDTHLAGLDAPSRPSLYFSSYIARETLVVRTSVSPLSIVPEIQRRVSDIDREQPLSSVRAMDILLAQSLSRRSYSAGLLGIFSVVGLALAAIGLYGVISYSVAQRTQEIGVRMALGARREQVFRLILTQGLLLAGVGLVIGLAAAAAAARLMSSLLFGIAATDMPSFVVAGTLLLMVALLACFIPAYRATRVDPLVALHNE